MSEPLIYPWDKETKIALPPRAPQIDQRASALAGEVVYMPNAFATDEEPPEPLPGKVVCRLDGVWQQVDDNRGEFDAERGVYTGVTAYEKETRSPVAVSLVGPLPDELTFEVPGEFDDWVDGEGWVEDAERAARAYDDRVNYERARRIAEGCVVTVTGVGAIPVQGRQEDKDNLSGLLDGAQLRKAAGDTSTTVRFRDGDNVSHDLVPDQIIELWSGASSYVRTLYEASWNIKDTTRPADPTDDAHWPAPVWPQQ